MLGVERKTKHSIGILFPYMVHVMKAVLCIPTWREYTIEIKNGTYIGSSVRV